MDHLVILRSNPPLNLQRGSRPCSNCGADDPTDYSAPSRVRPFPRAGAEDEPCCSADANEPDRCSFVQYDVGSEISAIPLVAVLPQ